MAQTKRKRRRKHRGTPAGTIEARGRTGKSGAPQLSAKEKAKLQRTERLAKEPTWRSSFNRAAIAAAAFGLIVVLAFGRSVAQGVVLAAFVLLIYVPMTYYLDRFMHERAKRRLGAGQGRR